MLEALLAAELALFEALDALLLAACTVVWLADEADLPTDAEAALVALSLVASIGVMVTTLVPPVAVAIFKMSLWTLAAKDLMSAGSPGYQLFVETLERSPLRNDPSHLLLTTVDATLAKEAYCGSAVTCARYELTFDAAAPDNEETSWATMVVTRIATRVWVVSSILAIIYEVCLRDFSSTSV